MGAVWVEYLEDGEGNSGWFGEGAEFGGEGDGAGGQGGGEGGFGEGEEYDQDGGGKKKRKKKDETRKRGRPSMSKQEKAEGKANREIIKTKKEEERKVLEEKVNVFINCRL